MSKPKLLLVTFLFAAALMLPAGSALAATEIIWWAEFHDNTSLKGEPVRAIRVAEINNDWGYNAPLEGVPADHFSVRWSTTTEFEEGHHTFSVTVDDGVRLWVDGKLLIDQWHEQSVRTFTASTHLSAGSHDVQMAYFEKTGSAVAKLWWRLDPAPSDDGKPNRPHKPHQPDRPQYPDKPQHPDKPQGDAGTILIDNISPGFVWGGPSQNRQTGQGGVQNSFYWTQNTTTSPENYAKWVPHFQHGGTYEVFAHIPGSHATTASLRYRILHNGERHDSIVDQGSYRDKWVSLGTYYFSGDNKDKELVLAYDNTREPLYSTYIAFDAMRFVRKH